ncbi:MAG: hypothetical protein H7Y02_08890 [Candidatus Obscuribacterales bacterium]|nr:hypothetical protein [Steroidobacteraceae bacterium]
MKTMQLLRAAAICTSSAVALIGPSAVYALGTPAGTQIQNTAQVDYTVGGTPVSVSSNPSVLTVAEILNVNVAVQTPTVSVAPAATQRVIVVRVTNTGNGSEVFNLLGNSIVAGDDFDPTPTAPFIYFDTDGSGDLSPADVAYSPGSNDPVLAADQNVTLLIVNNIPAALPNGAQGRTQLTAAAATGTGAPGTVFGGAGVGGVDAVVGTSGATQIGTGTYVVAGLQLNAVKSQTVVDQFGGTRPVPGARINYQIVITPTGTGTANAVIFSDAIPANTTYVAGTLRLNGAALTDGADADAGQFATLPSAQARVALGDLTSASGVQTINFGVTIN